MRGKRLESYWRRKGHQLLPRLLGMGGNTRAPEPDSRAKDGGALRRGPRMLDHPARGNGGWGGWVPCSHRQKRPDPPAGWGPCPLPPQPPCEVRGCETGPTWMHTGVSDSKPVKVD